MKKFILGLIIGLIFVPISVKAWNARQMAQPIYGADCPNTNDKYYKESEYYRNHPDAFDCSVTVYVFDDADNKCYIAKGSNAAGISCVKR